jgi:hypothetical protein
MGATSVFLSWYAYTQFFRSFSPSWVIAKGRDHWTRELADLRLACHNAQDGGHPIMNTMPTTFEHV